MLSLFIFVILIFNAASRPDIEIAEIHLVYDSETNANFTAWIDEPMKIIIENAYARYIWCVNYYAKSGSSSSALFVPETEFAKNNVCILNIPKVTAEMSTRWGCTVLQAYHRGHPYPHKGCNYTARDLHFHLYVKGASQVILTANKQNVKFVKTNMSVEYDGVANYTYEVGEDVEFSCRKAQDDTHRSNTVRLEYFNAKGIRLLETEPGKKMQKFRPVLNITTDKYYLDCVCASTAPIREYRYRTTFYMKKLDKDSDTQFTVPIIVAFGVAAAVITMLCVICKRTKRAHI